MHVLYDSTTFVRQRYGGISRYFSAIISRMILMRDVRVSLHMGYYINRYGLENLRAKFANVSGVRRPAIGKTHWLAQRLSERSFRRFARRVPHDVYHTTGFFEANLQTSRPKVMTVH